MIVKMYIFILVYILQTFLSSKSTVYLSFINYNEDVLKVSTKREREKRGGSRINNIDFLGFFFSFRNFV